mmetsp:Transcript_16499/g.46090  ORF Transcript_16499/g.46090 Transcript_16499/m.46090 type:complete len:610 (-) Transcript_16499:1318-3147(-)
MALAQGGTVAGSARPHDLAQASGGIVTTDRVIELGIASNVLELVGNIVQHRDDVTIGNDVERVLVQVVGGDLGIEGTARNAGIGSRQADGWNAGLRSCDDRQAAAQTVSGDLHVLHIRIILELLREFSCQLVERNLFHRLGLQRVDDDHQFIENRTPNGPERQEFAQHLHQRGSTPQLAVGEHVPVVLSSADDDHGQVLVGELHQLERHGGIVLVFACAEFVHLGLVVDCGRGVAEPSVERVLGCRFGTVCHSSQVREVCQRRFFAEAALEVAQGACRVSHLVSLWRVVKVVEVCELVIERAFGAGTDGAQEDRDEGKADKAKDARPHLAALCGSDRSHNVRKTGFVVPSGDFVVAVHQFHVSGFFDDHDGVDVVPDCRDAGDHQEEDSDVPVSNNEERDSGVNEEDADLQEHHDPAELVRCPRRSRILADQKDALRWLLSCLLHFTIGVFVCNIRGVGVNFFFVRGRHLVVVRVVLEFFTEVDEVGADLDQFTSVVEGVVRHDGRHDEHDGNESTWDAHPHQERNQNQKDHHGTKKGAHQTAANLCPRQRSRAVDDGDVSRVGGAAEDSFQAPSASSQEWTEVLHIIDGVQTSRLLEGVEQMNARTAS